MIVVLLVTGTRVAAMPRQKEFRVIPGGKPNDAAAADPVSSEIVQLLHRVRGYRRSLAQNPNSHAEGLVSDLEDAVGALRRLERPSDTGPSPHADEYRRLIADLDKEIMAALGIAPL
jgi:hypothetical protein